MSMARRHFMVLGAGGVVFGANSMGAFAQTAPQAQTQAAQEKPAPFAPELVEDFVRKGHIDLPGTKAALAERPSLLNATWDWGGGDFETALGGAGHMGNREIAEFLIGQGARLDIFVAAMLGKIDIVRGMLDLWPNLLNSRGPHGIPLMRHALAGGEPAKEVVDYLRFLKSKSAG